MKEYEDILECIVDPYRHTNPPLQVLGAGPYSRLVLRDGEPILEVEVLWGVGMRPLEPRIVISDESGVTVAGHDDFAK